MLSLELRDLPHESRYHFFTSRRTHMASTPLEALRAGLLDDVLRERRVMQLPDGLRSQRAWPTAPTLGGLCFRLCYDWPLDKFSQG